MSFPSIRRARAPLSRALAAAFLLGMIAVPATAAQDAAAAIVTQSGQEISISGVVKPATVQAVQRDLSAPGGDAINTLVIESTGGDIESTIQLGQIVHARKLTIRVNEFCAAYCTAVLAPAAERLVVPEGSFLIFTTIITPSTRNTNWKYTPDHTGGPTPSTAAASARLDKTIHTVIDRQNAYWKDLNLDPSRIYAVVGSIDVMKAALTAAGKTDAPFLVPDAAYMHKCLGVASVDMPDFTVSDSTTFAHIGKEKRAMAFLIDGRLYYDGAKIATFDPPCLKD